MNKVRLLAGDLPYVDKFSSFTDQTDQLAFGSHTYELIVTFVEADVLLMSAISQKFDRLCGR